MQHTLFPSSSFHGPLVAVLAMLLSLGCSCEQEQDGALDVEARDAVTGLTTSEAKEVLVTVGSRPITLGDYAATLLRMDRFERLRYQTEDRQKALLDEMIEVELLAQEAKRRGLDKDPQVQLRMQEAMRDELLSQLEKSLPGPEAFSEREVRDYYEKHREQFIEPLRHRALVIAVGRKELAAEVLSQAQGSTGKQWGELASTYSLMRKTISKEAPELSGDLGFVSAPGQKRGQNESISPEVREAIFSVQKIGDVVPRVIASEQLYYVVRLGGVSPQRERTVVEADRTVRVELRRQKFLEAERKLEQELRKKYPVVIDEQKINAMTPTKTPDQPRP